MESVNLALLGVAYRDAETGEERNVNRVAAAILDVGLSGYFGLKAFRRGNYGGAFGWSVVMAGSAIVGVGQMAKASATAARLLRALRLAAISASAVSAASGGTLAVPSGLLIAGGTLVAVVGLGVVWWFAESELEALVADSMFGTDPDGTDALVAPANADTRLRIFPRTLGQHSLLHLRDLIAVVERAPTRDEYRRCDPSGVGVERDERSTARLSTGRRPGAPRGTVIASSVGHSGAAAPPDFC